MSELEPNLRSLATELEWPPTPSIELRLAERRRRLPRLAIAIALLAVALAVAFAVPQARSAILRFFHIGGVTIERVGTLPLARERALAVGLGAPISRREAERLLGPVRLPPVRGRVRLYSLDDVVSTILTTPDPTMLSELGVGGPPVLKKVVGPATSVTPVRVVNPGDGLWISGERHVFILPAAPPRLAGNVLVWEYKDVTFRLEGRTLDERTALRVAREISR